MAPLSGLDVGICSSASADGSVDLYGLFDPAPTAVTEHTLSLLHDIGSTLPGQPRRLEPMEIYAFKLEF